MDEQRKRANEKELAEYARKLAELTMRIHQMSSEQRQQHKEKISQVKQRVERMTPAMLELYTQELNRLNMNASARSAAAAVKKGKDQNRAEQYSEMASGTKEFQKETQQDTAQPEDGKKGEKTAVQAPEDKEYMQEPQDEAYIEVEQDEISSDQTAEMEELDVVEEEKEEETELAYVQKQHARGTRRTGHTGRPKRHLGRWIALLVALLIFIGICSASIWIFNEIDGRRGRNSITTTVTIERGSGPLAIGNLLQENGIIQSGRAFQIYVRVTGTAGSLQYGEFELNSHMSYGEIIEALQTATDTRDTVTVTFPEGNTAVQYARRMEEAGLCTAEEFLNVANNSDFSQFKFWDLRQEDELQFMKCEGYLFPNTYEFLVGDDVYNMVEKIYAEFDAQFTDEMYARTQELNMTLTELVTLASLVQEEAGNDQSKLVSAVFHNRLKTGMTLGSNVAWYKEVADDNNYLYDTLAGPYGYGSWNAIPQEVGEAYDTYTHEGLPVGPVSNPGLVALEAALWPEENCNYLYFQTDTLGNYHYANTYEEHLQITSDLEAQGIRP